MKRNKEETIVALMADYKLSRQQAEKAWALRENPLGDVVEAPDDQTDGNTS